MRNAFETQAFFERSYFETSNESNCRYLNIYIITVTPNVNSGSLIIILERNLQTEETPISLKAYLLKTKYQPSQVT